ncbi:MAG: SufS family cysteine desulfurase [Candidatus Falkowbacteria bacterium]|nr:MAG: SufS family cysteine desulfurase [Candidatus Falkowbacteria bacterium]
MIKRTDFPILNKKIQGQPLVYFDNASTAQKSYPVVKALSDFYKNENANVHRGLNPLANEATKKYEAARDLVAKFIGAQKEEIIFTPGATASINLVARSWGEANLRPGDIVVLSIAEHHANIVPWLQLQEKIGIKLEYIPLKADGSWDLLTAKKLLNKRRVKLLAVSQVSNVLGIINPVTQLIKLAKQKEIITLIDAAQSIAHLQINVKKLGCDFLVFSGHKLGGPTGIGVLYGRQELLATMPPFMGGGDMISFVKTDSFGVSELPYKFEAGTPNIAGVIGLGATIKYLESVGYYNIQKQEQQLTAYFLQKIEKLAAVKILGTAKNKLPIFSLTIEGIHPHDAADILGQTGIILRAGHHCAQPLHDYFEVPATLRASLSFYNTKKEIDYFIARLQELIKAFK